MVLVTQSLQEFFKRKGLLKKLVLLCFGHTEILTEKLYAEYIEWLHTPEGESYLKGGENYSEEYGSRIETAMKESEENA